MSTAVTYTGNQYSVPAYQDTGYAQGSGNLSSYLIALATGSLTLSGGTFTLTADADFGANFGLKSLYYKSRSSNLSTTGFVRGANTDIIGWRNATNAGNNTLTSDANNRLAYSGGDIGLDAGKGFFLTSPDGTKTARIALDNDGNFGIQAITG